MDKRFLTTREAAEQLGVSTNSLLRWAKDGLVTPALRTAQRGDYRWNLDDLTRQLGGHPDASTGRRQAEVPEAEPQRADRPQYPAVAVAIVTSRLGVLAGRRNDGRPPWTFIAGKCETGESPADAIIREVKEETGLLIKPGVTIGERIHPKTGKHLVYVAAIPATRNRDIFVGDEEELAEVRWLPLYEAEHLMPDMFPPVYEHLRRHLTSGQAKGQRKAS
jgi:8-oxo-dGTP pyrophosphatase MutT (NUDIX family)